MQLLETIETSLKEGIFVIKYNRPARKNAFSLAQFEHVIQALNFAKENEDVRVVVIEFSGAENLDNNWQWRLLQQW